MPDHPVPPAAHSSHVDGAGEADQPPRADWVKVLTPTVIDVIVPMAIFYLLRNAGLGIIAASVLSGLVPLGRAVRSMLTSRRPDVLALFMISALVVGTLASVLMNSPRLLLAKDGVITGLLGAWILITLLLRRPFMLSAGTAIAIAKRGPKKGMAWARQWDTNRRFRHGVRVVNAIWGVALVLDAVVRVVIAYALPMDSVPAVTNAQWIVLLVLLYGLFLWYAKTRDLLA